MDMAFGSVHLSISAGGVLRLLDPTLSDPLAAANSLAATSSIRFITNCARTIGSYFIDHCINGTDRVGSIVTIGVVIASDHIYNIRRV
jgi:hypothetical protein